MQVRSLAATLALVLVAGCSGPKAPIAVAGPDQMVTVGELVKLDGSASSDPQGKPLSYRWEFVALPAGSHAQLNAQLADGSTAVDPSFIADVGGDYVVRLTVKSDSGTSAPSQVKVTASMASCGNNLPVAQIGMLAPFTVPAPAPMPPMVGAQVIVGNTVQLDGSTSSTMDNAMPCSLNKELFFSWRFVSLPAGANAAFNDPQVVNPSFRAETRGTYIVELVVTDSAGLKSAAVQIEIVVFDPRVTVPGATGLYNSLVLDPGTMDTPKIAYYDSQAKRAMIAVCTGSCDTAPVWSIHTIDSGANLTPQSQDVGQFISLGASATGTLYAGYYDATNCRAVYAYSADHGVTWASSVVDVSAGCGAATRNGQWLSLTVSPVTGNPALAYQYFTTQRVLRYAVCTAGCATATPTWVTQSVDTTNQNTGFYTSVQFNPSVTTENRPAIAYRLDQGQLLYAACSANCDTATGTWALTTVDNNQGGLQTTPGNGTGASLAFASTGAPSIAYRDEQAQALRYAACTGNCAMPAGWGSSIVDGGDVGEYASLAMSPAAATLDQPRITYRDANNNTLKLAMMGSGGWQLSVLDDQGNPRMSSLKLTAKDGVRVSYSNGINNGLRYLFFGP